MIETSNNPHLDQPLRREGCPLPGARLAAIVVHGRNQGAAYMADPVARLNVSGVHFTLPQAAGNTWYPNRFMEPIAANEPMLGYALDAIDLYIGQAVENGLPRERIALIGFSQGACLVAEYAVRHPCRYAAVICWTGGLIGPAGTQWPRSGSMAGTPMFFGGRQEDEWVPADRVRESAAHFRMLGGDVEELIEPGAEHLISNLEIQAARRLLFDPTASARSFRAG
jgi:phospholipase/carboxylesterase